MKGEFMNKHIPGPWKVIKTFGIFYVVRKLKKRATGSLAIARVIPLKNDQDALANARLIAAAPDMLKALYEAKVVLRAQNNSNCLASVLNAISKAEGK